MTTRTILLTLAATVAPLYAQQPGAPVPAAQLFTTLAAPAGESTSATPEQRAQVFGALALLPPSISDVTVLTNVGGNLLRLAESGKLPELDASDLPAELLALDNIALASTPANAATRALLEHALVSLSTVGSTLRLAEEWGGDARRELSDTIIETLVLRADAASTLPEGTADDAHLPAAYLVLTTKPGEEGLLKECSGHLLADLQDGSRPGVTLVNDANGFSGIRMDVTETYRAELDEATRNMAPRRREQLLNELAKHPLYILTRQQGNALIIALCEDPQELKFAASPADSLLSTDMLAACDANLAHGMIAAAHVSPELSSIGNAVNSRPGIRLAEGVSSVFARLAEQEPANKEAYEKAAAAVRFLTEEMQKFTRPISRPTFLQIWCDGDLHLAATADAQGCSYRSGELRLATMADAPKTSLYSESTPMKLGITPPDSQELLEAVFSAAEGFSLTLAEEDRAQTEAALTTVKAFLPELRSLAAAASTIGDGLNGQLAVVMDSHLSPLPAVPGAQPGIQADTPRFAIYAGVDDRSKLGEGWDALRACAAQVAVKLGAPAEIINMLPISSRQVGTAMSYSITLPFFTQDAVPSVAVTDTGLTVGSSANLTAEVANSATGSTPFKGGVFALKFAPLAKTLRSLATALDHDAEEAEPAAVSDVRLEKEKPVAVIGGNHGPTSIFLSSRRADSRDTADKLSTAAAIFEYASTIAEGVFGTSTIENGQHKLHMEVKMK